MINISGSTLKAYITSSRAIGATSRGIVLENGKSNIIFNFNELNPQSCIIHCSRGKGTSGKIIINDVEHTISPNNSEEIRINGSNIKVFRQEKDLGEIYISSITLEKEKQEEQTLVLDCDWPTFLKKIGRTKGIKRTSVGLIASEYAEIEHGDAITELLTDPPNAFKKSGNKIIFIHPCRIYSAKILGNITKQPAIPEAVKNKFPQEELLTSYKDYINGNKETKDIGEIIFDSGPLKVNSVSGAINLTQSGNCILIRNTGKFSIPLNGLCSQTSYLFIIEGNRVNGNGKVLLQLETSSGSARDSALSVLSQNTSEISIKLNTGFVPGPNESYYFTISRPFKAATGNVIINKIKIKTLDSNTTPGPINIIKPIPELGNYIKQSDVQSTDWYYYGSEGLSSRIKKLTRFYALPNEQQYQTDKSNINGVINLSDYEGKQWFSRMSSGLSLSYSGKLYANAQTIINGCNVSICSMNYLNNNKRLYINEFTDQISEQSIKFLQNKKEILTPSLTDVYKIQEKVPNIPVNRCVLPWIHVNGEYKRKNYCVYYEKDAELTKKLVSMWKQEYGKLIIINTTVKLPQYIDYLSPYIPYPELYKTIVEANTLIYLSNHNNHKNGLIELAQKSNVNVISNNNNYILEHKVINSIDNLFIHLPQIINNSKEYILDKNEYKEYIDRNLRILVGM